MIHPLNKQISTISSAEIYPEAYLAVTILLGKKSPSQIISPALGTHITIEDLAMDACEKVIRANPMYLTKSYVRIAARCVCIDKLKRKKLITSDTFVNINNPKDGFDDTNWTPVEETIEGDITDYMASLEQELLAAMDPLQKSIYEELLKNKMYLEISETLGISLRTLERQIQELKWLCEYLLTDIDPDTK
jgi:DNA-directed RNA polymerase specialized sigma24 family protein